MGIFTYRWSTVEIARLLNGVLLSKSVSKLNYYSDGAIKIPDVKTSLKVLLNIRDFITACTAACYNQFYIKADYEFII